MDDKMVYELLKEVHDTQKEQGKELVKQGVCIAKQGVCISNMEKNLDKNVKDIAKHISRSDEIQKLNMNNHTRIENNENILRGSNGKLGLVKRVDHLEEPGKTNKAIKAKIINAAMWASSVGGAIIIVLKLMGKI